MGQQQIARPHSLMMGRSEVPNAHKQQHILLTVAALKHQAAA
jgi:hypothetical protein